MYPLDLASNPNYGHAITFTAQKLQYTGLDSVLNEPKNALNPNTALNQNDNTKGIGNISLYLPDTLNTTYDHNWGEISLTQDLPGGMSFFAGAAAVILARASFLNAPIVFLLPLFVRAFVLVLCPLTGRFAACLIPL